MNEGKITTNFVEICGEIISNIEFSHKVLSEKFYALTIEVPRLSDAADHLPVIISEYLIRSIQSGDIIHVKGQLRSYNFDSKLALVVFAEKTERINASGIGRNNPNSIYLEGFICKPPVYRITPLGRQVTDVWLAVNRSFHKSDYLPAIAWGRNAGFCANLKVGAHVKIYGRVQSREYQKKLNENEVLTKTAYEVSISRVRLA